MMVVTGELLILNVVFLTALSILRLCYSVAYSHHSAVYRAMHFSAKRGIAIACRLSVRLSVCL